MIGRHSPPGPTALVFEARTLHKGQRMGHRLTTALVFLNAIGLFACLILIAANGNQTPEVAVQFTRAIQTPLRLFVLGAGLPLAAWELAAADFDRSNVTIRSLESWATYICLLLSWALFLFAAWRLPTSIIAGFRV
jgi:hypothetical protein